jgi:hypothetical protein
MNDLLSGYMFIRKDVVFQVVLNLCDPCIGIGLSIRYRGAGLTPFTQSLLKDSFKHGSPRGGLC